MKRNRTLDSKVQTGFTLVELMVVVAIIALLAGVAIPQFLNYRYKAIRSEAVLMVNGAHKGQTAYFAGVDHYLGCTNYIAGCGGTAPPAVSEDINSNLGLDFQINAGTPATPHGYYYLWSFPNWSGTAAYELALAGIIIPGDLAYNDRIVIGMNDPLKVFCGVCYQDGIPFIMSDEILRTTNCPCH